mgnify:CR=1 FL=1
MSPASDVYSLGALLFRVLTARYPIEAQSIDELRRAIAQGTVCDCATFAPICPRTSSPRSRARSKPTRAAVRQRRRNGIGAGRIAGASAPSTARRSLVPRLALAFAGLAAVIALGVWIRSRLDATVAAHATPPTTQQAEPAPLAVDATLMRRSDSGSEPVADGGRVTLGDRLALEVHSTEPVWAYVFNRRRRSRVHVVPDRRPRDHEPALPEELHQLPGRLRGQPFAWQVTSAGGDESFVIVASRRPLPEMESLAASLDAASPDRAPVESNEATRGVGGMAPDPSPAAKPAAARLPGSSMPWRDRAIAASGFARSTSRTRLGDRGTRAPLASHCRRRDRRRGAGRKPCLHPLTCHVPTPRRRRPRRWIRPVRAFAFDSIAINTRPPEPRRRRARRGPGHAHARRLRRAHRSDPVCALAQRSQSRGRQRGVGGARTPHSSRRQAARLVGHRVELRVDGVSGVDAGQPTTRRTSLGARSPSAVHDCRPTTSATHGWFTISASWRGRRATIAPRAIGSPKHWRCVSARRVPHRRWRDAA